MAVDLISKHYLIIDDFSDMRSMLRSMLIAYGVTKIDMAANGKEAIKQLGKNSYDVVLCDYNLGAGKDGQQVLEEARYRGLIRHSTAFLMITAENAVEMVMGAVEYLPDDYLSKPFNKDMLRSRVEKVLIKKGDVEGIDKLLRKELWVEAVALCDGQIAQNPRNLTELIKLKSEILLRLSKTEEAGAIFESVLAKRDVPWAMIGLGKVRFLARKYGEAKNIFQKIIDENNTHMEAYDWLVKTLLALGDAEEALKILTTATEISPKAILRQMELGNLALKERAFESAAKAFKKAIHVGRNSIYQDPANYTKLAKIMGRSSGKDALLILAKLRSDYGKDEEANLHAAIAESLILKNLGREADAKQAYAEANALYGKHKNKLPKDIALELANACLEHGEKEKGLEILRDLVKSYHEDKAFLAEVRAIFSAAGLASGGRELIDAAIKELAELNNTGMHLAEIGKLDEAISFFEQTVEDLPDNITVNMNIVDVLLRHMQENGKKDNYLYKVRRHLGRMHRMDSSNENYRRLNAVYEKLIAS